MKLSLSAKAPKADLIVLLLKKDESLSSAMKTAIGKEMSAQVAARIKAKDFEGSEGESLTLYGKSYKRVVLLGTGEVNKRMPNAMQEMGGKIAGIAKAAKAKKAAVILSNADVRDVAYGLGLGVYSFDQYKEKPKKKVVELGQVTLVADANKTNKEALADAQVFADSSPLTRDLVNLPAGDLNTEDLAKTAKKLGREYGMKVTVLDEKKLAKLGCGAIVGVGQGAEIGSRMVFIEYKKGSKAKVPSIAFVGKGVVFDTGGLNLKPTGYMETMKQDMAGAATVLGTMKAIAEANLKGNYLGVLCCAENAVSEKAQRPGDVVKSYSGKTIEITNTDAEGRLCLADGLAYTEKNYKPKKMLNIATLTGAVSVALGYHITGVMGNNQAWIDDALKAAKNVHERAWQLPLDDDFVKATKGDFTDLKNSTNGVRAGSSMGGAFLRNFVGETPWTHFDIGGTAWAEKPSATTKYGATASALRTFFELAKQNQG